MTSRTEALPTVEVDVLIVPDCPNAAAAMALVDAAVQASGLPDTVVRVSVIDSHLEAERRGFVGSPTILVNGVDPFAEPDRRAALACRVYHGAGGVSGLPPANQLCAALLAAGSPREV